MDVITATDLTPVELRSGMHYKREDLFRDEGSGINGAKYRACLHLISDAVASGAQHIVSASSVLSPQAAMAGVIASQFEMACTIIVGATTPDKAVRHTSVRIAHEHGADVTAIQVGYNPALQRAALAATERPGVWRLPYGITTPSEAAPEAVQRFLEVGAPQVCNLPDEIETLVLPFGSANTACGVLYGLHDHAPSALKRVVAMEIGPDRKDWAQKRLESVGRSLVPEGVELEFVPLHPFWAEYGDRMKETLDDIVLHPTYEGKMVRYLNTTEPEWWTRRDGTTCFWIVGGEIG